MLTNKQLKQLKGLANTENAVYQIGKNGIGDGTIEMLDKALTARELVKISVLRTCDTSLRELALDLAVSLKAEIVQILGHTIVLFRQNPLNSHIKLVK